MSATIETITANGNKIELVYERDSSLPVVYMKLVFMGSGSIADADKISIAKFTSKMLGEGTKKLGSVKFAQSLDEKAIRYSAASGFETSIVDVSALKEHFAFAVDSVADLLADPNFTPDTFEKCKTSLIANSMKKEDDFDHIAEALLKSKLFANTPMSSDGLGSKDDVKKIKLEDVKEFYAKYFGLRNLAIVIGGDISLEESKALITKMLARVGNGEAAKADFFEAKKITQEESVIKETKQAYVYFGAPLNVKAADADSYKAKVAGFILGSSGFGSRLMEEVRVKNGLAYSVYSRYNVNKTSSYFSGYLQTKLENEIKAKELVAKVIANFVVKGATQKELDSAKKFILGSEPLRNETLAQRLSRSWNDHYMGFGVGHSELELEKINNLTLQDLNNYIKSHNEISQIGFAVVSAKK